MKVLTIIATVGAAGLAVLAVTMAQTNPHQPEYEEYAVQKLSKYLKTDVCQKTPKLLENLIKVNCHNLVDSSNSQIREIIAVTTKRQNYIFFSVYSTDLKINSWIPSYRFETVGAFANFYTYSSEQQ